MQRRAVLEVAFGVGVVTLAGCVPPAVFATNRAALVPHAAPPMHSGRALDGSAELSFGASRDLQRPAVGDPDDAVEIPGTQLHGGLRVRAGRYLAFGVVIENGLGETAHRPKGEAQPAIGAADVGGFGLTADASIPLEATRRWQLGLHLDVIRWSVPYVEWRICVENCGEGQPTPSVERGEDATGTFGAGASLSYRSTPVTWFAGISARNHPSIQQKGRETAYDVELDPEVEPGAFNTTLAGGVEIAAGPYLKVTAIAYQTVTRDPVVYGPGVAAVLTLVVPRAGRRR